jgi:nitrate reductase molybdenum cofactor assembly chaperone
MVSLAVTPKRTEIVALLADLVDYPAPELAERGLACRELLAEVPAAAILLDAFLADLERLDPGRIEELYSSAFDLDTLSAHDATCYPYVGHHLLGESYRRSRLMVWLLERYGEQGFEVDRRELPDHLLVMLRFLARCRNDELASELVGEAILPALARMTQDGEAAVLEGESARRIYLRVLEAVRLALAHLWPDVEPCTYENAVEGGLA